MHTQKDTMKTRLKRFSPAMVLFMVFSLTLGGGIISGCQLPGVLAEKLPTEVPAEYQIEDRPTLILVEDPDNVSQYGSVPSVVAGNVEFNLINSGAISQSNIINRQAVAELKAEHPDFSEWSAAKVGLMAGAQQVIFVKLTEFSLKEADFVYRPSISGTVRLVDTRQNDVIWPAGREGHPVRARLFYQNTDFGENAREMEYAREVSAKLGISIGRLFHEWIEPVQRDYSDMGD